LLAHLSAADVVLQVQFWGAAVLYFWPGLRPATRWMLWLGLGVVAVAVCCSTIHPPQIVVYETYRGDQQAGRIERAIYAPIPFSPDDHLRDQSDVRLNSPSGAHLMGTTSDAADLLSNMIYASRIALSIGFISTGIALVIGVVIGGLMGYYVGWIDLLGMRLVEIFDAIPTLLLLLCFVAIFTPNLYIMMAIIGATSWVGYSYFIRAEFLSLRQRDFVQAARAAGLPVRSILFRHMLPNGLAPLIVSASFGVASAILIESTLSFLGIGLVNEASWGNLLNQAVGEGGTFYWWIALYPGLAIFLTVFAYNLIGEALRDALDPKLLGVK
jgi:peptide/nickel transport system permease protein